jgi:hypothetical protein
LVNGKKPEPFHVEKVFTIDPVATGCAGPSGLAVGPSNEMALGCGGTNSLIINNTNGKVAATVTGEGGTDETWYDPTSKQFYFARSTVEAADPRGSDLDAISLSCISDDAQGEHLDVLWDAEISPQSLDDNSCQNLRMRCHASYPT